MACVNDRLRSLANFRCSMRIRLAQPWYTDRVLRLASILALVAGAAMTIGSIVIGKAIPRHVLELIRKCCCKIETGRVKKADWPRSWKPG